MRNDEMESARDDGDDLLMASLVRPKNWINPVPKGVYDLVVIGAGPAGLVAAAGAAGLGAKVALIERRAMGGDCLNFGCVPSKALLSTAKMAASVRNAPAFGIRADEMHVDFEAVMARMRAVRTRLAQHDSVERFTALGVDVFLGTAEFVSPSEAAVGNMLIRFSKAVICTGTRPAIPDLRGIESVPFHTNESIFELNRLPASLAIIGAGPVGCELAQVFSRLGTKVTLFTSARGALPQEEPEASEIVREQLKIDGVGFRDCGRDLVISPANGDLVRLQAPSCDLVVEQLLVATGREANIDGLGLSAAGISASEEGVVVDDFLRTANRRVYAAGDVCSVFRFTHAADAMARTVIRNALFFGRTRISSMVIPRCIYTAPELARVGSTPTEALKRGIEVTTFTQPMGANDRAALEGAVAGVARIHVKKGGDQIVGATIVGPNAGELISIVSLAMANRIGLGRLGQTIFPYPTLGEILKRTSDQYQRSRLSPSVAKLMKRVIAWRR